MSYQYRTCTRDDYESRGVHDWHDSKDEIAHSFKLEDLKFDGYCDPSAFSDWLADMEYYFDWYKFSDAARLLFARRN